MSRLPSQLLLPAASPIPPFSKKGCLRESASTSLFDGSYSNMLSMRSNNWWCSSASDSKYRWRRKGWWRKRVRGIQRDFWERNCCGKQYFCSFSTENHCISSFLSSYLTLLPVRVCSFLWRISLPRSFHPSPDGHDRNTSASCYRDQCSSVCMLFSIKTLHSIVQALLVCL